MGKDNDEEGVGKVRTPDDGEYLAVVLNKMGYSRFKLYCSDGKERMGRIPGSKRRRMWVKEDDVVLIEPWDIQGDEKCEMIWHYSNAQKEWLEENGFLDDLKEFL
jgi:translation initiation factor 1A